MSEQTEAAESVLMELSGRLMREYLIKGISRQDADVISAIIEAKWHDEFVLKHGGPFIGMPKGFSQSFVTEHNRETGEVTAPTAPPSGFMQDVAEGRAGFRRELGYLDGRLEAQCELHAANQRADNAVSDLIAAREELARCAKALAQRLDAEEQIADAEPVGYANFYKDGRFFGNCDKRDVERGAGSKVIEIAIPVYRHPVVDTDADKAAVEAWKNETSGIVALAYGINHSRFDALLSRVTRVAPAPTPTTDSADAQKENSNA